MALSPTRTWLVLTGANVVLAGIVGAFAAGLRYGPERFLDGLAAGMVGGLVCSIVWCLASGDSKSVVMAGILGALAGASGSLLVVIAACTAGGLAGGAVVRVVRHIQQGETSDEEVQAEPRRE